jgi:cell division protein FtsQ
MKKWFKRIIAALLVVGVLVILFAARRFDQQLVANKPIIELVIRDNMAMMNETELLEHLKFARLFEDGMKNEDLDLATIEKFVNELNEVEHAEVFRVIGKDWFIRAYVRRPIARVLIPGEDGFYLDNRGKPMRTNTTFNAHVPVFTGLNNISTADLIETSLINNDSLITNTFIGDIYRISTYVCNSAFYNAQIVQVHYRPEDGFVLIPRVGNHEIIFGRARSMKDVEKKFKKLDTFYSDVVPYEGWDKYASINLRFDKQIVARKK